MPRGPDAAGQPQASIHRHREPAPFQTSPAESLLGTIPKVLQVQAPSLGASSRRTSTRWPSESMVQVRFTFVPQVPGLHVAGNFLLGWGGNGGAGMHPPGEHARCEQDRGSAQGQATTACPPRAQSHWVLLRPVTLQCCHSVCQGSPGGLELFQGQGSRKPAKNLVLFPQIWTPNRKSEEH